METIKQDSKIIEPPSISPVVKPAALVNQPATPAPDYQPKRRAFWRRSVGLLGALLHVGVGVLK